MNHPDNENRCCQGSPDSLDDANGVTGDSSSTAQHDSAQFASSCCASAGENEPAGACCTQEESDSPAQDSCAAPESDAAENEADGACSEEAELSEYDQALLKIAELEELVARRNADLYNLQQEYSKYVKRAKSDAITYREQGIAAVLKSLLSVLDDAHLAREHGDLDGPAGKIVEKLEDTLVTNYQLERFGEQGEDFDPELHEALMHQTSSEVPSQQVAQLIQPGYKQGDKVLRPARVGVVSPE
ncbi:nucleotide exchange factor GrpE [Trueperella sp. LYQ143]|uniref:nucleotide exchange factor GrpE n=1 Tax=Trueperella sp. LYQ143 TaxID=3391059 RepID=UPI00398374D3